MIKQIKELVTPAWLRSFFALALVLLTMSFMNSAVFPLFDTVNPYVREVTTSANIVTTACLGLVAFFAPARLNGKALNTASYLCLIIAAALLPSAFGFNSLPLLVIVGCLIGIARAWVMMSVGLAASRLNRAQIGSCVIAAFLIYYPCDIIALNAPAIASVLLFLLLPILTLVLTQRDAEPVIEAVAAAEPPLDLAVTQPNTFLPLGSQIFVCLFLFRVTYGFALRFGEESGAPLISAWAILVIICFGIYMFVARKSLPIDSAVSWSVLLVIVGFYAIAVDNSGLARLGVTLLSAGSTLFDMVSWMVMIAIMARNLYGSVAAFAWAHSLMGMGTITGAQLALRYNDALLIDNTSLTVLLGCFIALFAAYALFSLRNVSFAEMIRDIAPAATGSDAAANIHDGAMTANADASDKNPAKAAQGDDDDDVAVVQDATDRTAADDNAQDSQHADAPLTIEQRCQAIAARYNLTKREAEVLGMLARGRNRAYIEEALVVSRNTVNSHVKHIYAKLDIHSHQELIDIVENEQ